MFMRPTLVRRVTPTAGTDPTMQAIPWGYKLGRSLAGRAGTPVTTQSLRQSGMNPWLKLALFAGGALVTYKVLQAMFDVEYPDRTLPRKIKDGLKWAHIDAHGEVCTCCGHAAGFADLAIDHIIAWAAGGRTSISNSRVICRWCNSAKGATTTVLDMIRGRGGRADY